MADNRNTNSDPGGGGNTLLAFVVGAVVVVVGIVAYLVFAGGPVEEPTPGTPAVEDSESAKPEAPPDTSSEEAPAGGTEQPAQ